MSAVKFKLGCDPEIFVFNKKLKHHVSAHTFAPGTKAEPYKVKCGAVQLDGTAIEFNIDPAETAKEFQHNVSTVLNQVREMLPADCELSFLPSIVYPKDYWASLPDKCKELGCEPTWDAHNMQFFAPPVRAVNEGLCTGAGHLHIGWTEGADILDKDHQWDCGQVIKKFEDFFLPMEQYYWTNDKRRRELYGKHGESRIKTYGVEFRGLSNAWLKLPEEGYDWVFDTSEALFNSIVENKQVFFGSYLTHRPAKDAANFYNPAWNKDIRYYG